LTDVVLAALKTKSWQEALDKNKWTPAVLTGKAFDDFVDADFAALRGTMHLAGMV
jgi:putative tricarboxylic transport membrane protein